MKTHSNFSLGLILIVLISLITLRSAAVTVDPHRGLYLNNFFALDGIGIPVEKFSILCSGTLMGSGHYSKEEEILEYCKIHHFTYIILYDLSTVFNNATEVYGASSYLDHLKRFISNAKNNYGIVAVGANIGGVDNSDNVFFYNANRPAPSTPTFFTDSQLNSPIDPIVEDLSDFISLNLISSQDGYDAQQVTKLALKIQAYSSIVDPDETINVLSLEYEFWNSGSFSRFQQIAERLHDVKVIATSIILKTEVYVALFDDAANAGTFNEQPIADFLDFVYPDNTKRFDRIMTTYYTSQSPGNSYDLHNYYRADKLSISNANTNPATEIYPLFSTKLVSGGLCYDGWIKLAGRNNIFRAERDFYNGYYDKNTTTPLSNILEACHNIWYPASTQAVPRINPNSTSVTPVEEKVIYFDGPTCTTTSNGSVTFSYNGPREANVGVRAYLLNSSSVRTDIYGTSTSFAQTSALTGGTSNGLADQQKSLPKDTYSLYSELEYTTSSGSITHSFANQEVKVTDDLSTLTPLLTNNYGITAICSGTTITMRSTSSSAVWYQVGNSNFIGTGKELSLDVVSTTNTSNGYYYTISGLGACTGPSSNLSIDVYANPDFPTITSSNTGGACNNEVTLGLTANSGCTYYWNNGSIGNSIVVNENQTYKVLQITTEGCERYKSANPTFPLGCDNADINLCTSNAYPSGSTLQNTNYSTVSLQSDYAIPSSVTLIDKIISGANGAHLIVPNGVTLKLYGCQLSACGNSWGGIVVENGGRLETYSNGSNETNIEHADIGINLASTAQYNLNATVFNRCETSLNFTNNILGGTINNCKFTCLSINNTPTGLRKDINKLSRGITSIGSTFSISGGSTIFQHLISAVEANGSSIVTINGGHFSDIHNILTTNATSAISISNSSLVLSYAQFQKCEIGVYTSSSNVDISRSNFVDINTGIEVTTANQKSVKLSYNTIISTLNGINLLIMEGAYPLDVKYNTITSGSLNNSSSITAHGIQYSTTTGAATNRLHYIRNNTITMTSQGDGISAINKSYLMVNFNNVHLDNSTTSTPVQTGINCGATKYIITSCNNVYSTGSQNVNQTGMSFNACTMGQVMCNTISNGGDGMTFLANNGQVNLRSNTFDHNSRGLYVTNLIGKQVHKGNQWFGSYSSFQNHYAAQNINFSQGLEIEVDANSASSYLPTVFFPTGLFINSPGIEDNCIVSKSSGGITSLSPICGLHSTPFAQYRDQNPFTECDTLIVSDTIPAILFMDEINYEARNELFSRLGDYPEILDSIIIFSAFYDSLKNTNIGAFNEVEQVEQKKDDAYLMIQNNIFQVDSIIDWHLASIAYNDSTMDSILISQNAQHYQDIEVLANNKSIYEQYLNDLDYTAIQFARAKNEDIDINNLMESNTQIINEIRLYCEELEKYDLDTDQENLISSIAHQCPQSGGSSVYVARAIYSLKHPNEYYDDESACIALGYFRKAAIGKNEQKRDLPLSYFNINPNPASDYIKLNYYIAKDFARIEFNLYNAMQQRVKSTILPSEMLDYEIKCDDLPNGVYFYTLSDGSKNLNKGKISIINWPK